MREFFSCAMSPDDGANPAGGAASSAETTTQNADLDKLKNALDSERGITGELRKQIKELQKNQENLTQQTQGQIAAALKALGHDDGSNDPETLQKTIAKLNSDLENERRANKTRTLQDRFTKAVGRVYDVDAAFALSGLSLENDSDEAIAAAVESLKSNKSFLFVADNGDQAAATASNPGATGPATQGAKQKQYTLDQYREITDSPEYKAQFTQRKGELYEEMRAAVREGRVS